MVAGSVTILTALVYLCLLFVVAHYGDIWGRRIMGNRIRPVVYALTLGVYCTSWTFYGSVGLASSHGLDFLPIYIGPLIVVGLFYPFILRIVRLAKGQNITSVADFVAARYGKSEPVAALVAIIMVIGVVPYIALQLKAISASISTVLNSFAAGDAVVTSAGGGILPMVVAVMLAGFAMAFGTRHIDATEHQDGLVLAIATESLVKLAAFLILGIYVTWGMFNGFSDLAQQAVADERVRAVVSQTPSYDTWITTTFLSACCILLLPRQFQMMVVENRDERDVKTAAWLFPLYLVVINIFVVPLAIAGLLLFPGSGFDRDMTVLALPLHGRADIIALITMIGGLSAATAMVIVESVALSIMVSNDLVMPVLLRGRSAGFGSTSKTSDLGSIVLGVRRVAILLMLGLGYIYYRSAGEAGLASIGLLAFAAVAQIVPAFVGGLFWTRATARGAIAGLIAGISLWAYTLFLPSVAGGSEALAALVEYGPLGVAALKPTGMLDIELPTLVHGVLWSLGANILCFVGFSLSRHTTPIERLQADIFVGHSPTPMGQAFRLWGVNVTVSELETAVARYLGPEHTRRAFEGFMASISVEANPAHEADIRLLRFAEHLLASAIGAASSRLVLSLLLRRRNVSREAALRLIDQASATLQYNRDLLQHALDFARQGITVFDRDLRLICWNREFRDLFDLASDKLGVGLGLEELLRYNAERGLYGPGRSDEFVAQRLEALVNDTEPFRLRLSPSQRVIEIRSARMPDGGLVTTYTDVTDAVEAEEALERTNETLEQRVRERTEELVRLNSALAIAKSEADAANLSKTRFLAAASHDILQPLNAARLYATSLVERTREHKPVVIDASSSTGELATHLDASLEAVEEILTALLEISRLDAGAMKSEPSNFRIDELLRQLRIEFEPQARRKGLRLRFVPCTLNVRTDRRLLRRLLQNLISNGIKYTNSGSVLVGCRRAGANIRIEVWDTGMGIPESQQANVFREFERLAQGAKTARGLGLGLSIVERLGRVLDSRIRLNSTPGKGSVFSVDIPVVAVSDVASIELSTVATPSHEPLAGMTVLTIDNDPRILEGMLALLSGWGCRVICASGLDEAQRKVKDLGRTPDVAIADYHLDEGDGLDAIGALREMLGQDLPALLLTADRTPEVRDRATELDVRVLNKPVRPAALRSLLSQWRVLRNAAE